VRWEPRASGPLRETPAPKRETTAGEASAALMVDFLGGYPPPHEFD
jgi:hypothetical protein